MDTTDPTFGCLEAPQRDKMVYDICHSDRLVIEKMRDIERLELFDSEDFLWKQARDGVGALNV